MGLKQDYDKLAGPRTSTTTQTSSGGNIFDAINEAVAVAMPFYLLEQQKKQRLADQQATDARFMSMIEKIMGVSPLQGQGPIGSFLQPMSLNLTGRPNNTAAGMTPDFIQQMLANFNLSGR